MTYTKPYPNIDQDNVAFWDGLREHKFLLLRCHKCGAWYWPAAYCRNHANEPFLGQMAWEQASGRGKVFAFTIHYRAFHPGYVKDVPYVYALIELDEGPIFSTMVEGCPPEEMTIGRLVEITFEDHPDEGFTLPKARVLNAT